MDTQEIRDFPIIGNETRPLNSTESALETGSSGPEWSARQVLTYLAHHVLVRYQEPPANLAPNGSSLERSARGRLHVPLKTPLGRQGGVIPFPSIRRFSRLRYADCAKPVLETALCVVVLPLVLLVMAVVAVVILIDSGRPVFFVQERAGRRGRTFRMYKFRTLPCDYNSEQSRQYMQSFVRGELPSGGGKPGSKIHKPFDKSQISRVGRYLRRTSLDELPQIFNVLHGEMSLVGPRPNVLWEVEAYQGWHNERLAVRPGITGLAQVRGRSALSFDDIVHHDVEYIRNQSLKLDLQIVWWTILSALTGRGAH